MIDCPSCSKSVNSVKELNPGGGFTETCPNCSAALGIMGAKTAAPIARTVIDPSFGLAPPAALDPVAVIRTRLAAVDAQIPTTDQLRALRRERAGLRRALRALGVATTTKAN